MAFNTRYHTNNITLPKQNSLHKDQSKFKATRGYKYVFDYLKLLEQKNTIFGSNNLIYNNTNIFIFVRSLRTGFYLKTIENYFQCYLFLYHFIYINF